MVFIKKEIDGKPDGGSVMAKFESLFQQAVETFEELPPMSLADTLENTVDHPDAETFFPDSSRVVVRLPDSPLEKKSPGNFFPKQNDQK